ncbi:hypothetical protein V6Z11_D11G221100 [Gossypium hirsutum]
MPCYCWNIRGRCVITLYIKISLISMIFEKVISAPQNIKISHYKLSSSPHLIWCHPCFRLQSIKISLISMIFEKVISASQNIKISHDKLSSSPHLIWSHPCFRLQSTLLIT